jgi:hypothetical protein
MKTITNSLVVEATEAQLYNAVTSYLAYFVSVTVNKPQILWQVTVRKLKLVTVIMQGLVTLNKTLIQKRFKGHCSIKLLPLKIHHNLQLEILFLCLVIKACMT